MNVAGAIDELAKFIPRDRIETYGGVVFVRNGEQAFLITRLEIDDGIYLDVARKRWAQMHGTENATQAT